MKRGARLNIPRLAQVSLSLPFILGALLFSSIVSANPVLNNVASGQATVSQTQTTTTVNQTSQQAIINWHSFNINAGESTHFQQPANGVALNRINPQQGASNIYGTLTATGRIILVNPAGIHFGPNAYVNVGGMIATTMDLSDQDFLNGNYRFSKVDGFDGEIINQGHLIASAHGLIALVGGAVSNQGLIEAHLGQVVLASGSAVTMSFAGNDLIHFAVDNGSSNASISNMGSLIADGGKVMVSAKTTQAVLNNVINMQGIVEAKSVGVINGEIILGGGTQGIVRVAGKLNASGKNAGEKGGNVTITGYNILLDETADIDVSGNAGGGNVRVGGNYLGQGPLQNANKLAMAANAKINASALNTGNGGEVILWSDAGTYFYGNILAEGGVTSGNGGFVETSGRDDLVAEGVVSTYAPNGLTGTWLLDPANVTISTAGDTSNYTILSNVFTPNSGATNVNINTTTLNNALASNNITVTTTNNGTSGGQAGTITVSNPITWASTNTLTLTAASNILINAAITTGAAGSALILNSGGAVTQVGVIGGSGSVTVTSTGISVFSLANTYSGGTTITSGTRLSITNNGGLGTTGNIVVNSGGTLQISTAALTNTSNINIAGTGVSNVGALNFAASSTISNTITLTDNSFIGSTSSNQGTLNGAVTDGASTFNLTKVGTGSLRFNTTNSYSGTLSVNAGNLIFTNNNQFSNDLVNGTTTVATGASIQFIFSVGTVANQATIFLGGTIFSDGDNHLLNNVVLTNNATIDTSSSPGDFQGAIDGNISGVGFGITKLGDARYDFSGVNTYSGGTNITGTLRLNNASSLGSGSTVINSGGTLEIAFNGNLTNSASINATGSGAGNTGAINFVSASGVINTNAITLSGNTSLGSTSGGQINGIINDGVNTYNVTKVGVGTLTLSNANTYNGVTAIDAGILSISAANNLGSTSGITFGGGTLRTTSSFTLSPNITLNTGGGTLAPASGTTLTYNGVITGANLLTFSGGAASATLILSNTNTHSAGTNITAGLLQITNLNALGTTGNITVSSGATLYINVAGTLANTSKIIISGSGHGTRLGALNFGQPITTVNNLIVLGANATIGSGTSGGGGVSGIVIGGGITDNDVTVGGDQTYNLTLHNLDLQFNVANSYSGTTTLLGVTNLFVLNVDGLSNNSTTGTTNVAADSSLWLRFNGTLTNTASITLQGAGNPGVPQALRITSPSGSVTINNPIILAADSTIGNNTSSVPATFGGTINGAFDLTVTGSGGQVLTLGGAIGNTTPLTSITAGGVPIRLSGSTVTTTGAQTYSTALTLNSDMTLTSTTSGNIAFNNTVNSFTTNRNLFVTTANGNITFTGAVGATLPIANLRLKTGTAPNDITFGSTLALNAILDNVISSSRNVTFANNVSSTTASVIFIRADNTGTGTGTVTFTTGNITTVSGQVNIYYNPTTFGTQDTIYSGGTTPNRFMLINQLGASTDTTTRSLASLSNNSALRASGLNYALAKDIDASATSSWNSGAGFLPIGNISTATFDGDIDGLGYKVSNLYINRPSLDDVGLFGRTTSLNINNIRVENANVTGSVRVGALLGNGQGTSVFNASSSGTVSGAGVVGGLIGGVYIPLLSNSFSSATVTSTSDTAGGLIGFLFSSLNSVSLSESYATGNVTGSTNVGGLVGYYNNFNSGTLSNSYSTGNVTATGASGSVVGGLVGIGYNSISNSYSTGSVTSAGGANTGGFAGQVSFSSTVTNSRWDTETSGRSNGVGTGSSAQAGLVGGCFSGVSCANGGTANLSSSTTYSGIGWNIGTATTNTWVIFTGQTRPMLGMEYNSDSKTSYYTSRIYSAHALQLIQLNNTTRSASYTLGADMDASSTSQLRGVWGTTTGNGRAGFIPIGTSGNQFTGSITGAYAVKNIYINLPSGTNVGLFGFVSSGATVQQIGVEGTVNGLTNVGGLFGTNAGIATNVYSTANVTSTSSGNPNVGGLVGTNTGTISFAYSAGAVTASSASGAVGGFAGNNSGTFASSYLDTSTDNQSSAVGTGSSTGVTSNTSANMMLQASYSGWDFTNIWSINSGTSYPYFKSSSSTNPPAPPPGYTVVIGSSLGAGVTVNLLINGAIAKTAVTIAGGNSTFTFSLGELTQTQAAIAYVSGNATLGNFIFSGTDTVGTYSGAAYAFSGTTSTANVQTLTNGSLTNTAIVTARGLVSDGGLLFSGSGSNLTFTGGNNFSVSNTSTYSLNGNITTATGGITFGNAVTLSATSSLTTTGGNIILNTVNSNSAGTNNLTLSSGAGSITFNGPIGTTTSLANFSATNTGGSNNLAVPAITTSTGITLSTGGAVTQTGILNTGTLTITSGTGINLFDIYTNTVSNFTANNSGGSLGISLLNTAATLTIPAGGLTENGTGGIFIRNNGNITVTGNVNTGSVTRFDAAGSNRLLTINGTVNSNSGVGYFSDNMSLVGATNISLSFASSIAPYNSGVAVNLGGADAAGVLGLTNTELNTITASNAVVRFSASGANISISNAINPAGIGTLSFATFTTGTVTQSAAATITATNLDMDIADSITLTQNNVVGTLGARTNNSAATISFTNNAALNVSTIYVSPGLTTNNGNITVTAAGLNIFSNINAGSANITMTSTGAISATSALIGNTFTLTNTSANSSFTSTSNNIAILGVINAAGRTFTLVNNRASGVTQSGALTASTLNFTNTSGTSTLTNASNAVSNFGTIDATGQTFNFMNSGALAQTGILTATNFSISSTNGVLLNQNNVVGTLAASLSGASADFTFNNASGALLTIGTVNGINGVATNNGGIIITNNASLTVSNTAAANDINAGTNLVGLTAGGTNNLLTITGTVAGAAGIYYTADNMTLTGTTAPSAGNTTLTTSSASTLIRVGNTAADGSGILGLSPAKLGTITGTGTITIGTGANTGGITTVGTLDIARNFIFTTGNTIAISHVLGGTTPLSGVTMNATNGITLSANITTNTASGQQYNNAVLLGGNITLASSVAAPITFASTINGGFTLAVNTTGATTFSGAIGNTSALTSLTTNAGGSLALNAGSVRTTGAQTYGEAATLGAATTLTSTSSGAITFGSTLNGGAFPLIITTTNGNISFAAAITNFAYMRATAPASTNDIIFGGSSDFLNNGVDTVIIAGRNISVSTQLAGSFTGLTVLRADYTGTGVGTVTSTGPMFGATYIFYNPTVFGTQDVIYSGGHAATQFMLIHSLGAATDTTTRTLASLSNVSTYWGNDENYAISKDIDASATSTWNSGQGFNPIGNGTTTFSGYFDGLGYKITNLYINRPATTYVGFFGRGRSVINLSIINANVTGLSQVGILGGQMNYIVRNVYTSGTVTLASGGTEAGGAIGRLQAPSDYSSGVFSSANVTGDSTTSSVGGLIGYALGVSPALRESAAFGNVTGGTNVGGFVGFADQNSLIMNSYATGNVTGSTNVGGFIGLQSTAVSDNITRSYSTGVVTGTTSVGGFVGAVTGTSATAITNSFWDTETSGRSAGFGSNTATITNLTGGCFTGSSCANGGTANLSATTTYSNSPYSFNIGTNEASNIWLIFNGATRPMLAQEYKNNTSISYFNSRIYTPHALQLIGLNTNTLAASYTLGYDIAASGTSNAAEVWGTTTGNGRAGFKPIGDNTNNFNGNITGAYAVKNIYINLPSGTNVGLFGFVNAAATVQQIGVEGTVNGLTNVGGLFGTNAGIATNVYSTANVTSTSSGNPNVGGLVGVNTGTISFAYSAGVVTANSASGAVGGFAGNNGGTFASSYLDTTTDNQGSAVGIGSSTGIISNTTANMLLQASYSGWDFTNIWAINAGSSYPYFKNSSNTSPPSPPYNVVLSTGLGAGTTVNLLINGAIAKTALTVSGGDVTFSFTLAELTQTMAAIAYVSGNTSLGNFIFSGTDTFGTYSGAAYAFSASTAKVQTLTNGSLSNSTIATARGNISDLGLLFSASGNNLTLTGANAFSVSNNSTYTLNGNITTATGGIAFNNAITQSTTSSLTTTGGNIVLNTVNSNAAGTNNLTLSSGAGSITFNGPIGTTTSLANFSATNTGGSNNLAVPAITTSTGITLSTGGAVSQTGILNTGTLTITSGTGINLFDVYTNTVSNFTANNSGGSLGISLLNTVATLIIPAGGLTESGSGGIFIRNNGNITVTGNVNTGSTTRFDAAGSNRLLTINGTVTSNNGISYNADNMSLVGATNISSTFAAGINPYNSGVSVNLGGADGAGVLGLTNTELNTITTNGIMRFRSIDANLSISGTITPAGINTLSLGTISTGTVTQSGGAIITATNLDVDSADSITLTQNNVVNNLGARVNNAAGTLSFTTTSALTVTTTYISPGLSTNNGNITLSSAGLTLFNNINAGTANVTLTSTGAIAGSSGVVTANTLTLTNTSANTTLDNASNSIAILGTLNATGRILTLTSNRASGVTQSGALTAGTFSYTNTAGTSTLTNASNAVSNLGTVNATGQTFNFTNSVALAQTGLLTATNFSISSTNSVNLNQNNVVGTLAAALSTNTNAFTFNNASGALLTINSVNGINGVATNNGAISITNNFGITLANTAAANDINAGTSSVALTTTGANSVLTITGAVAGSGGITYTADNMTLTGTTAGGAGATLLQATTSATAIQLGTGATDAAAQLGLSQTELATITGTGTMTIGNGTNSGGISVVGLLNIGRNFVFTTGGTTLVNAAINSVTSLTVNATLANINANITATGNSLTFNTPVVLTANTTLTDAGDVTFNSTVNSDGTARDLTINTSGGNIFFNGAVGGTSTLGIMNLTSGLITRFASTVVASSIVTDSTGTTEVNGGSITTTGAQTYGDPVTLGANTSFTITGTGALTFSNTLNSSGSVRNLTAYTANGNINFANAVGNTLAIALLRASAVTAPNDIVFGSTLAFNSTGSSALQAGRNITFANSATNASAGTLKLVADYTGTGTGTVTVSTGSITSSGGVSIYYNPTSFGTQDTIYTGGTTPIKYMLVNSIGTSSTDTTSRSLTTITNTPSFWNQNFALARDIDASITSNTGVWNNGGLGFLPIGTDGANFYSGLFDGLNHTITNLYINRPTNYYGGLFGYVDGGSISNIGLKNIYVIGSGNVGALIGHIHNSGTISNSYSTGTVSTSNGTTVLSSAGGLIGIANSNGTTNIHILNSFSTATVTGATAAGLLGAFYGGTITNSYSTGPVYGVGSAVGGVSGGLIGYAAFTTSITNSYSSSNVYGSSSVGGLIGYITGASTISNSYSTGSVSGASIVGGFVGYDDAGTGITITNAYSTGAVTGTTFTGGFAGILNGPASITNSFYDSATSGQGAAVGTNFGSGTVSITSATFGSGAGQLANSATYSGAGWNIGTNPATNVWLIFAGVTRPMLAMEYSSPISSVDYLLPNKLVSGVHGLQLIGLTTTTLAANYTLLDDIKASGSYNASDVWGSTKASGPGFIPIGNTTNHFTGNISGGYAVTDIYINLPAATDVGLFGFVDSAASVSTIGVSGTVNGRINVGGLIGTNAGTVSNVYSVANVNAPNASPSNVGGLVGTNSGNISFAYSAGKVTITGGSPLNIGGFAGNNSGTITTSYYDNQTSGQASALGVNTGSASVTGNTTSVMQTQATYVGWDFTNIWKIDAGTSYPYFKKSSFAPALAFTVVISSSLAQNTPVVLWINGANNQTVLTAVDGSATFTVLFSTLGTTNAALAYVSGNATLGNFIFSGTDIAGIYNGAFNANTVNVQTLTNGSLNSTALATARGVTVDSGILFTTSGNNITLTAAKNFTLNSGTYFSINGNITTSGAGNITFNNATTYLTAASTLTATGGVITANSILGNVAGAFAINASTVNLNGAIANNSTFNVTGTTALNGGSVNTTGTQTYNSAVTMNADTSLTTTNALISFASTLNSFNSTPRNLITSTGTGSLTFSGAVGAVQSLGTITLNGGGTTTFTSSVVANSLTTDAGGTTAINGGAITTTGAQTYNDAVTLGNTVSVVSTASNINFANTISGANALTVNGSTGVTFGGTVGTLTSLTVTGTTTVNGGTITTNGASGQVYNGAVLLGALTTFQVNTGPLTFNSTIDSVGSNRVLNLNSSGTVTLNGSVGSTLALSSLTTNSAGTTAINADIRTTGAQNYNDIITLNQNVTLTTTSNGAIFFGANATINSFNSTPRDLTITTGSGTITLSQPIGGNNPIGALSLLSTSNFSSMNNVTAASVLTNAGGAIDLSGTGSVTITTSGAAGQVFNKAILLTEDTITFTANGGGPVTFGGTINSNNTATRNVTVNSSGITTFGGDIGTTLALASLTTDAAGTLVFANGSTAVTTTGTQTYNDPTTVTAATTTFTSGTNIIFNNTVTGATASRNITLTGTGSLGNTFTIGSNFSQIGTLTVNGGTGTNTLAATTNATKTFNLTGSNAGNITGLSGITTFSFTAFANVTGGANTDNFTLGASGALTGTLDGGGGNDTLTGRNATTSWTLTSSNAGNSTHVNSFINMENIVGGSGTDTLTGSNTTNTWNITSANAGNVTNLGGSFSSIDSIVGGSGSDTFNLGGSLTAVSDASGSNTLSHTAGIIGSINLTGTTQINTSVTTTGTQTYTGAVTLNADSTLTTTNSALTFGSIIDSLTSPRDLTIATGTAGISLGANIGTTLALNNLTLNTSGSGAVSLSNSVAITASNVFMNSLSGNNNAFTLNLSGSSTSLSGISNVSSLTKGGNGLLTLGANSYSTTTALNAGAIRLIANSSLGTSTATIGTATTLILGNPSLTISNNLSFSTNSTLLENNVNGNNTLSGTMTLAGTVNINIASITNDRLTINGAMNGTGVTINKSGLGTLTLSGNKSYTGTTNINLGTLSLANNTSAGSSTIVIKNGTTLAISGSGLTITNPITMQNGSTLLDISASGGNTLSGTIGLIGTNTINVNNSANTLTLGGAISGTTVVFNKAGAGNLALTNTNTFTGTTNINAGRLTLITNAASLNNTTVNVNAGATLNISNALGANFTNAINLTNATITTTGTNTLSGSNLVLSGNNTINATGTLTISKVVNGSGNLFFTGNGTVIMSGTNNYSSAITLSNGTLTAGNASGLGTGILNLNGGTLTTNGNFTLANSSFVVNGLATIGGSTNITLPTGSISANKQLTITNSAVTNFSGAISGTGGLIINGGTTQVSASNASFAGIVTLTSGTLQINSTAASILGTGALRLNGGILLSNVGSTIANSWTLGGNTAINGSGSLNISGNGTLLTGNTLTLGGAGIVTFNGALNGAGNITISTGAPVFASNSSGLSGIITLNGGSASVTHNNGIGNASVIINANTTFTLNNVTLNNNAFTLNGNASQAATISSFGNSRLGGAITLTTSSQNNFIIAQNGNLRINNNIDGTGNLILLGSAVQANYFNVAPSVVPQGSQTGTMLINGEIGRTTPLNSIISNVPVTFGGTDNVTIGNQHWNGESPITLVADAKFISLGGNVTIDADINGHFPLTIKAAGTVNLNGAIGNLDAVQFITIEGRTLNLNNGFLNSTGLQNINLLTLSQPNNTPPVITINQSLDKHNSYFQSAIYIPDNLMHLTPKPKNAIVIMKEPKSSYKEVEFNNFTNDYEFSIVEEDKELISISF